MIRIGSDFDNPPDMTFLETFYSWLIEREIVDNNTALSVYLTMNSRDINRRYRGVDLPTDVLSFEGEKDLGELVIDLMVAESQRGEQTLAEEVRALFLHGLLHLLGLDHTGHEETRVMRALETELLNTYREFVSTSGR